nr:uncharacterized protein LOC111428703 [Onthophagus taurus]
MEELRHLLELVIYKESIQDPEIDILEKNDKGEGYLGVVTPVVLRGTNKILKVIVKTAPIGEEIRKHAPLRNCYITEINFYTKIYPLLRKFQLDRGDVKPFINIAKCYGYSLKNNGEGIVMENLKEAGFSVCERRRTMSKQHIKLALEEFSHLHALSYALKEYHPKVFNEIVAPMTDNFLTFLRNADFKSVFDRILDRIIDCPKIKFNGNVVNALTKFRGNYMEFFEEMSMGVGNKYSVITHGDCWTNNMMFKYDDVNNPFIPTSMRLIDWQLQKVGSPAEDISYFLYACSDKSVFNNLDDWLRVYHNSLMAQLTKLGCASINHLSFHELKSQYEKYAKYGFLFSCMVIKLMLSDADEVPDLSDINKEGNSIMKSFDFDSKNEDVYISRVVDLAIHAYNFKII